MIHTRDLFTGNFDDEDEDDRLRETRLCYREARRWWRKGYNVVPRNTQKKHPAVYWTHLQTHFILDQEMRSHYHLYAGGVGFITGAISNIVVIETDGLLGLTVLDMFECLHGPLPKTLTIRSGSGRGFHYHFRHPGHRVTTRANTSIKLDVKGDGGFCVLPPTLHESGSRYEIVCDAAPANLPEALLDFIEQKAAEAKGEKVEPRNHTLRSTHDTLAGDDYELGSNTKRFKPLPVNLVNVAIVQSMLDTLPDRFAIEHDDWLGVGFALHHFDDGDVGFTLWKKFSERCPEKASKANFETRWASFDNGYSGTKITLGSLRHHAEENGWSALRQWDRSIDRQLETENGENDNA